jgi:hypothetical protein
MQRRLGNFTVALSFWLGAPLWLRAPRVLFDPTTARPHTVNALLRLAHLPLLRPLSRGLPRPTRESYHWTRQPSARRRTHARSTAPAAQTLKHAHVDIEVGLLGAGQKSAARMWPSLLRLGLLCEELFYTLILRTDRRPPPPRIRAVADGPRWGERRIRGIRGEGESGARRPRPPAGPAREHRLGDRPRRRWGLVISVKIR